MRVTIQSKLNDLTNIDSGQLIPDALIETGTTYFGYDLQDNYVSSTQDQKELRRLSIIGFVVRKTNPKENTLEIVDSSTQEIISKLKELNFKLSSENITLTNDIEKNKITGYVNIAGETFIR